MASRTRASDEPEPDAEPSPEDEPAPPEEAKPWREQMRDSGQLVDDHEEPSPE